MAKDFLTAKFPELEKFPSEIDSYDALHKFSLEQNDLFWSTLAKSRLDWFQTFDVVREGAFTDNIETFKLKWFLNGKLNVSGRKKREIYTYLFIKSINYLNKTTINKLKINLAKIYEIN